MSRRHTTTPAGRSEPLLIALAILGDRPAATAIGAAAALSLTCLGYVLIAVSFSAMGVLLAFVVMAAAVVTGLAVWAWRWRATRCAEPSS